MTSRTDPRVDDYIDALPEWQQSICRQVRELVHAADPEVQETIKRRVQPYFVLDGNTAPLPGSVGHPATMPRPGQFILKREESAA